MILRTSDPETTTFSLVAVKDIRCTHLSVTPESATLTLSYKGMGYVAHQQPVSDLDEAELCCRFWGWPTLETVTR